MSNPGKDEIAPSGPEILPPALLEKSPEPALPLNLSDQSEVQSEVHDSRPLTICIRTFALMSATLIIALDVNILATAIPKITSEFHRLDDVSWYGAAYRLTQMALQPIYGRLYSLFPLRIVLCISIGLFGIGSIVCATAASSMILIVGRAIQGCGSAGVFSGVLTLCTYVVSKRKLALLNSVIGTMFTVASLVGPVIGGIFAESYLTWRFCFWINLPIGAVSVVLILVVFTEPVRESTNIPLREKLAALDVLSSCTILGSLTCLILGLQWGGISLPWSDSRVWGCILGFGLLLTVFLYFQIRQKEKALIPIPVLTQRTVGFGCIFAACIQQAMSVAVYYMPFYFQASKGLSPRTSGIYMLALSMPDAFASITSGTAISVTGHYIPWLAASGAVLSIGAGLLSTLNLTSSLGHIIGFELLVSMGFGLGIQVPLTANRNVVDEKDLPIANSLFIFSTGLGSALGLSIAQSVFLATLDKSLDIGMSRDEANRIIALGAGNVDEAHISPDVLPLVRSAYNDAVRATLYLAVASAGVAFLTSWALEWRKVEITAKSSPKRTKNTSAPAEKHSV